MSVAQLLLTLEPLEARRWKKWRVYHVRVAVGAWGLKTQEARLLAAIFLFCSV